MRYVILLLLFATPASADWLSVMTAPPEPPSSITVTKDGQFTLIDGVKFQLWNDGTWRPVKAVAAKQIVTTRPAQGHTHTCPRCGTTWDHASNPGHNCPNCGTQQLVQDRTPRPVTIRKTEAASAPTMPATIQRVIRSSGGCANGNCPYVR